MLFNQSVNAPGFCRNLDGHGPVNFGSDRMEFPPDRPWAKLSPRHAPSTWHPLTDHCHDVAAVFQALLSLPTIRHRLATLAGRETLPEGWATRLTVLAFLHDFGKANRRFQERRGGHIEEAVPLVLTDLCVDAGLDALDAWASGPEESIRMLGTILAHHGQVPELSESCAERWLKAWAAGDDYQPLAVVAGLVDEARRSWPEAFAAGVEPLPSGAPFWHQVLGLLQLADWLGSDDAADAFPFSEAGGPDRRGFASERARALLRRVGFDVAPFRASPTTPDFSAVSPYRPSEIQRAVGEAPGPIVVMESETGSGKTEAALYRFARLFMAGRVDGLYLALPTRVAASQMVSRVQQAVERMFPDPAARPVVVRALPGDAGADGVGLRRLPGFEVEWNDNPDEAERRRRWAAEGPKRFLAAPIAVGTIDQALLGAVRVRHAQMRSASLSRSLLVVDEVHASDVYMTQLLRNLLAQHLGGGGEALLLSATLGAEARTGLMLGHVVSRQELKRRRPSYEEASAAPYPCVAVVKDGRIDLRRYSSRRTEDGDAEKRVTVLPSPSIADPDAVAMMALEAARAGARVLVIRNTVRDAIATRRALEAAAPGDPVQFTVNGVPTLHHGRFARDDRRRLDAEIERHLGREAPRKGGLVVVGTQTLEISLDCDADLLITDLAPVDVLLQRIGRLHRHRRDRPGGFERPLCHVLMPADFEPALATVRRERMTGPHGFGSVYDDLLALEATRALIGFGAEWRIPTMNRRLVEDAIHTDRRKLLEERLAAIDPRWRDVAERRAGEESAHAGAAAACRIDWQCPVTEFRADEQAATRLGGRDLDLSFDPPRRGPFGTPVTRLVVPAHLNPENAFQATDLEATEDGFSFRLGSTRFRYGGFGLQRV